MKKYLFYVIWLSAIILGLWGAVSALTRPVLEDVQISVIDSLWTVEPEYDALGNSMHAFVTLGKDERCVMSATLKGRPAKGEMIGYTFRTCIMSFIANVGIVVACNILNEKCKKNDAESGEDA